jgi:hypothetical protein
MPFNNMFYYDGSLYGGQGGIVDFLKLWTTGCRRCRYIMDSDPPESQMPVPNPNPNPGLSTHHNPDPGNGGPLPINDPSVIYF